MQIGKNKVTSIEYTLTNNQGEVLDTSKGREPLEYIHGTNAIIPGLEMPWKAKSPAIRSR